MNQFLQSFLGRRDRNGNIYFVEERSKCILLQLCWSEQWREASKRLRTHPREAWCVNRFTYRTALHLVCFPSSKAPEFFIDELIRINPGAVSYIDKWKQTPLHIACCSSYLLSKSHVIQRLLNTILDTKPSLELKDAFASPSILFAAAKTIAPQPTLNLLLGLHGSFVVPCTGGETYWEVESEHEVNPLRNCWGEWDSLFVFGDEAQDDLLRQLSNTSMTSGDKPIVRAWKVLLTLLMYRRDVDIICRSCCLASPLPPVLLHLILRVNRDMQSTVTIDRVLDNPRSSPLMAVRILMHYRPSLLLHRNSRGEMPFLTATLILSNLDTIFNMLVQCPQALQLQRSQ